MESSKDGRLSPDGIIASHSRLVVRIDCRLRATGHSDASERWPPRLVHSLNALVEFLQRAPILISSQDGWI